MKCDKCGTEWDAPVNDCPVCESGYCCVEYAQKFIRQRDEAVALLRLALPRLGHPAACCSVRPTEEWEAHGSMSFDNCSCGIKAARAFLASLDGGKR